MGILRPAFLVFENVSGLVRRSKRKYLAGIINGLLDLQYSVQMKVLDASDYGVPQNRRRLFIIATAFDSLLPGWPSPCSDPKTSVFDAIGDLHFKTERKDGIISTYKNDNPEPCSYAGKMRKKLAHRDASVLYNHRPDKRSAPPPGRRILSWDGQTPTIMATKSSRFACLHPGIPLEQYSN